MELRCAVQQYAWGKIGLSSAVAALRANAYADFSPDADKPYAELWMGTHTNGPSVLAEAPVALKEHIDAKPEVLGSKSRARFGDELPFLFKVLSGRIQTRRARRSCTRRGPTSTRIPTTSRRWPSRSPSLRVCAGSGR